MNAVLPTKNPPAGLLGRVKFLGPGFILSASIVGSGELITTTTLGAQAGFTAFWVIVVSCLVKVPIQLEFGRRAILTGETPMQAFNRLPGIRAGKGHWSHWVVLILITLKVVQIGGILGATALVLHLLSPSFPPTLWALVAAVLASALLARGYYRWIERISLVMVFSFTILTLLALLVVQFTEYSFSAQEVWRGQDFTLSGSMVIVALGAFGITGVGSDEIIAYNYWCLEKGYAAYTGPQQNNADWLRRAGGWIRVMYLDAFVALVIYTSVTAAFYLLGASVLHARGEVPQGNEVIKTLSIIYTNTFGTGVRGAYLVGAFFVLFSSVFTTLALWTRLFHDVSVHLGWVDPRDLETRKRVIRLLTWTLPILWVLAYMFIQLPVLMILSGGVVGSLLLCLVAFAAICFRYRETRLLKTGRIYDVALWLSIVAIVAVALYSLLSLIPD